MMTDIITEKTVVAIGGFASLHMGHQELISLTVKLAREKKLKSCVFTFDKWLENHKGNERLMTTARRTQCLKSLGVDYVFIQHFNDEFKAKTAEEFVREVLKNKLNAAHVVVGENFRFGRNAEGDSKLLESLCGKYNIECSIMPLVKDKYGEVISTSNILKLARLGEVEKIKQLCGSPFSFSGTVVHGRHDGRKIGFPTVNVRLRKGSVLPAKGVYVSSTEIDGKDYPSITNIGNAPTFGWEEEITETHIIGVSMDLYGRTMKISLHKKIRDIIQFSSVDELVNQLRKDTKTAVDYLKK